MFTLRHTVHSQVWHTPVNPAFELLRQEAYRAQGQPRPHAKMLSQLTRPSESDNAH